MEPPAPKATRAGQLREVRSLKEQHPLPPLLIAYPSVARAETKKLKKGTIAEAIERDVLDIDSESV
jgi:hypothetical protein